MLCFVSGSSVVYILDLYFNFIKVTRKYLLGVSDVWLRDLYYNHSNNNKEQVRDRTILINW
jgi:hypothetical protein